jgi:hypothetical protein
MYDIENQDVRDLNYTGTGEQPVGATPAQPEAPQARMGDTAEATPSEAPNRHAAAGRKGGLRFHELIQRGLLYEKEHGLQRGRQRLRQLVEEGRLYEREHGFVPEIERPRAERVGSEEVWQTFLQSLVRMVKPVYRDRITRLLQELEGEQDLPETEKAA